MLVGKNPSQECLADWTERSEAANAPLVRAEYLVTVATIHLKQGSYNLSEAAASRALSLDAADTSALFVRGDARARGGNLVDAVADYTEILRVRRGGPHALSAMKNRAVMLELAGRWREAIAQYDEAIALEEKSTTAYVRVDGITVDEEMFRTRQWRPGKTAPVDEIIERFPAGRSPELARLHLMRGKAYEQLGNQGQANRDAGRAIEIDPKIKR